MASERPKPAARVQIYMDARHREWWKTLPRYDRSRVVAEALDLYRAQNRSDTASDTKPTERGDTPTT